MEHSTNGRQQRGILVGRKGGPSLLEPADGPRVPPFCRPQTAPAACLSAVCRARYASPTPARVERSRPCVVKAAQVVGMKGVGALALALTRMVHFSAPRGR